VHGVPVPGMAIVPVGLGGSGLTPVDVISVEPSGMPVGETSELEADALPSGEVVPTVGVGATIPLICATATLQERTTGRIVASLISFTGISPSVSGHTEPCSAPSLRSWRAVHGQKVSGRFTTVGVGVLRTTTQRNACTFDGLISMCGR